MHIFSSSLFFVEIHLVSVLFFFYFHCRLSNARILWAIRTAPLRLNVCMCSNQRLMSKTKREHTRSIALLQKRVMKNKSQQQQHTEHTINLMELNSRRLIFSITISSETLDFVFIFFLAFAIDCTYAQTMLKHANRDPIDCADIMKC